MAVTQYLEMMLSSGRDLIGRVASGGPFIQRLGTINDSTKRVADGKTFLNRLGQIKDLAMRKSKDKGMRR